MKPALKENNHKVAVGSRIDLTASVTLSGIPQLDDLEELGLEKSLVNKGLAFGEVEVIVSNSAVDRYGESIVMEGIDLSQIKRNPVVLWGHDYYSLPIGQIVKLWKSGGNLMARIKLDYDIYDFANTVYQMIIRGTINAVSIGGIIKQWSEDYTVIEKMEMMELSVVPIGAHPDALVTSKSFGMEPDEFKRQFEDFAQRSLLDKLKHLSNDEVNNHINSLEALVAVLKQSQVQTEPQETKEVKKVKLLTLKQTAGEVAYHAGQINKVIKIKLKEKNG